MHFAGCRWLAVGRRRIRSPEDWGEEDRTARGLAEQPAGHPYASYRCGNQGVIRGVAAAYAPSGRRRGRASHLVSAVMPRACGA